MPPPGTTTVDTLDLPSFLATHGIDKAPAAFFDQYIALRKPVLIKGELPDEEWREGAGRLWKDNEYLKKKAGEAMVKVETRGRTEEKYGQGKERRMRFGDFVEEVVEKGNELLYLVSGEGGGGEGGREEEEEEEGCLFKSFVRDAYCLIISLHVLSLMFRC